jgi:protein tyrosine/serine phosphatase
MCNVRIPGLLIVVPAICFSVSARAETSPVHVNNFARVSNAYYRGGQPEGQNYQELAALGIKTVIDLKHDAGVESNIVQRSGMRFYSIPLTTTSAPSADSVQTFLKLVNDPSNQPVFVHCQGGRDRTGLMTAIYRVSHDGWDALQAYAEMKQYGYPSAVGSHVLKHFLYDYARRLTPSSAQ